MEDLIKNTIIVGEETINQNKDFNNNWWKPATDGRKRLMFCGTHIYNTNGYAKISFYILKYLQKYKDIKITLYGFQYFNHSISQEILRNDIGNDVIIHDAYANENPKRNGFGEKEIGDYIKKNPQDIIIIFNDSIITSALTQTIINECGNFKNKFRLISYMDQVYAYQKKDYINMLNSYFDGIIAFTPYWKDIAYKIGIKKEMPIFTFCHGFDHHLYYPIPQNIARMFFNFNEDDFLVLNANRNQPRKRWDITIISWAIFVERHYKANNSKLKPSKFIKRPIKLVVGTDPSNFFDLMDIFENEIKFKDVPWEYAKNTIHFMHSPQQLSDRDINILHNSCDVGLNTCDGEGFGLLCLESAGLGKGQIASHVGGIKEFLNNNIAILLEPKSRFYIDNKSNGIGGAAELISPEDCAEAFWKYLSNPDILEKHGKKARQHILTNYAWEKMIDYFYNKIIPHL